MKSIKCRSAFTCGAVSKSLSKRLFKLRNISIPQLSGNPPCYRIEFWNSDDDVIINVKFIVNQFTVVCITTAVLKILKSKPTLNNSLSVP